MADELYGLVERLYPIGRSLTGAGVRETLSVLEQSHSVELARTELASGTRIYDWSVPREWRVNDAYVARLDGTRVIDLADSNLHLVGYSHPLSERVRREELEAHLHSLPGQPDLIPYRTAYYADSWGFCLTDDARRALGDAEYDVLIDTELFDGSLTLAEARVAGGSEAEVLLSCNTCHPSLANDGVSAIALTALLARELGRLAPRLTYRFLFGPGTLGPLAWLARNEPGLDRLVHGLVVSCVGDGGPVTYKRSRQGDSATDRVVTAVLAGLGREHTIEPFVPWGGDERQFCSPGFDLPIGCLSRTPHGAYPEYHTSADDLSLVTPAALAESWDVFTAVLRGFEENLTYRSENPKGEPQLGRRGLYRKVSGGLPTDEQALERARAWVLNLADGEHDLAAIVERSSLPWPVVNEAAQELEAAGLLRAV